MRFDKNADCYLLDLYDEHRQYNGLTFKQRLDYIDVFGNTRIGLTDTEPIRDMAIFSNDPSDGLPSYEEAMCGVFNNLHRSFLVDYVSPHFAEEAIEHPENIAKMIGEMSLFDIYGKCAGHILYGDCCLTYSITETTALTFFNLRNAKKKEGQQIGVYRSSATFNELMYLFRERDDLALILGLIVLATKKLGKVETVHVGAGVRRTMPDRIESVVVNRMPFQINVIDSSWLKTIIRTEGFEVRGHYRLQACGVGRKEHKLIFIKGFKKHGYVRTAKKIVYERKCGA